jgi:hypothetical protein
MADSAGKVEFAPSRSRAGAAVNNSSEFSVGWIVGLYAAVAVVGFAAWQVHQGEPLLASTAADPAERAVPSSEAPATAEVESPSIEQILSQRNEKVAKAPARNDLFTPESPVSNDPQVRARQEKIKLGIGASLAGYRPFDDENAWNQRIDDAPVDPMSEVLIRSLGADRGLHPCFGSGEWEGSLNGIPYVVVSSAQPGAPVEFTEYGEESDAGPYPIPPLSPIEQHTSDEADRHVIVLDRDNWKLYELFHAFEVGGGWKADGGAIWDLNSNAGRPAGWTSADAAGLPIFPGLVRYDEVEAGEIRHALRFTAAKTRKAYVPPASHWASPNRSAALPPMGMRVRLKKDFDVTKYPRDVQVILRCLQTYGMILADNGSNWFVTGAPDERWDNDALHLMKDVKGENFEVIRMDGLVTD